MAAPTIPPFPASLDREQDWRRRQRFLTGLETNFFKFPKSPISGYVLTCDANGVASWTPITVSTPVSVLDSIFTIADNLTLTKIAAFQCAGLPVGTSTFSFPPLAAAGTDTLAALGLAQTFSGTVTIAPTATDAKSLRVVGAPNSVSVNQLTFEVVDPDGVTSWGSWDQVMYQWNLGGAVVFWPTGVGITPSATFDFSSLSTSRVYTWPNLGAGTVVVRTIGYSNTGMTSSLASASLVGSALAIPWMISVYAVCTTAGTGSVDVNIGWTDNVGARLQTVVVLPLTSTGYINATIPIRVASGNITRSTTYTSTGTYALYIRATAI